MGKTLERGDRKGPQRTTQKPARLGVDIRRQPLAFIEPAPNPLQGQLTRDVKPVERLTEEQERLQQGFIARAKAERFRFAETTKSDYYFTVVFEHGSQAAEFLKAAGYRETDSQFVDGMILAQALGIELPPSPFKLRKLRPADRSLRHLVTTIPRRSGFVPGDDEE